VTWQDLLVGLGLAAVIEGLALALAPSRLDQVLSALRDMSPAARQGVALATIGLGVAAIWIARGS